MEEPQERNDKPLMVWVPKSIKDRITAQALAQGRSTSNYVRWLLIRDVLNNESETH